MIALLLRFDLTRPSHHLSTQGSSHNYLRISRILKCLSEMGLEHLNTGFLLHVLNEQSESHELNSPGLCNSMDRWWANCIRNEEERLWIRDLIRNVRSAEDSYVFTRQDYEDALENRLKTGRLASQEDVQKETETEIVQHGQDNNSLIECDRIVVDET
jgi:Opioid growth factor receptor (OGFr) conserved region